MSNCGASIRRMSTDTLDRANRAADVAEAAEAAGDFERARGLWDRAATLYGMQHADGEATAARNRARTARVASFG